MSRIIVSLACLCLSVNFSFGQRYIKNSKKKLQAYYKQSATEAGNNNYEKAISLCDKILSKEADNINVLLRKGSFLLLQKKPKEAEHIFLEAIELDKNINPKAYYSLGVSQFKQDKFDGSIKSFTTFINLSEKPKKLIDKAERFIEKAKFIKVGIQNPVAFNPLRLSDQVNTELWEYSPTINAEGNMLIYLSKLENNNEELFYAEITKEGIGKGKLFEDFNYPSGEGAHCISPDGKTIIFTSCDYSNSTQRTSYGGCDLYMSTWKNGKWSFPRNLGSQINSRYWESQPSLSANGKQLFFSSKRKGALGGSDLYMSKFFNGQWSKPENLGSIINTAGNEESPFIHPDGKTLYFRSDAHMGYGDFDIFFSRWDEEKMNWSKPENLGYPINTKADDGALFVDLLGTTAYYTSNRHSLNNSVKPNLDLYQFELYKEARPTPTTYVKGKITNGNNGNPILATIEISSDGVDKNILSKENGEFLIPLPSDKNYALHIEKEGYIMVSDRFELKGVQSSLDPYVIEIKLWPIPDTNEETAVGTAFNQKIPLKNILFKSGSAVLLDESNDEINRLNDLLIMYPQVKIEIHGHTDNIGSPEDNLVLSRNRAKSVHDELIKKGVEKNRISYTGFGESSPIADNNSEEGRKLNRRTEFVLVK